MAKENNKDRILKLLKDNQTRQTAEEIAMQLDIQRNTASGILNDLVREGIVQKEKTRPVMFSYIEPEEELPDDPFTTFIGADKSLKDAVEKCKLSAGYPNRGMPILLFGSSGFGIEPINDFIYCLQNDIPFVADGNDGLQAKLIAEAVHESLEKGVAVKIKRD